MKKFGILLLAAIMGSGLTIGTLKLVEKNDEKTIKIEHVSGTPIIGATYTVSENGEFVPLEFTDVAKEVMPAVVHIKSTQVVGTKSYNNQSPFDDDLFEWFFGPQYRNQAPQNNSRGPQTRVGAGSGVIISPNGYIVTNNHVIENADDIEVALNDNRVYKAKVIGADPSTDIALIQIKEENLPIVPLENSDDVEVGEWVLAVGNPFNLNSTVTAGIVSAKARNINILDDQSAIESFIQTDAAINPGNSGGALVNLKGGLVGINTAIASPTGAYSGYGFAVPANIVSKVVEDLMKYGTVQRGYLGIMIRSVDGELAKENDLDVTEGVYVDSIQGNSAAGDAGLKVGDVVLKVDNKEVKTSSQLQELIGRHRPGDKVPLTVDRKGKTLEYEVILRNKDGETKFVERENREVFNMLGAELANVDTKTAKKLGIEGGVKVTKLLNGNLQRNTNVKSGFIITKVDGKLVKSIDDLTQLLQNKKGGVMLEGVYEDYPGTYYYAFGLD